MGRWLISALFCLALLSASSCTPPEVRVDRDYQSGFDAYVQGDYKAAFPLFQKSAENGDVGAQFYLGTMYALGEGVTQDYLKAHLWLNLAATAGDQNAKESRNMIEGKMTPAQKAEAQKLIEEWIDKFEKQKKSGSE